jgi:gamma-glutamyltranspeptidase/glutathione hydrolase
MAPAERGQLKSALRWRGALRGSRGCVAADHPLAVEAGLEMVHRDGSAADAAVAMAAAMTVVQPYYSHLGGDLFALTFDGASREVRALNSSGPAPASANAEDYRARGGIPGGGARSVTLPGCVDGWWRLHEAQGRLPWAEVLAPATRLARDGFPASRQLAGAIRSGMERCRPEAFFARTFGVGAAEGGLVRQPELAGTLEAIARGGAAAFYSGVIAETCRAALAQDGAAFSADEWRGPARWGAAVSAPFARYRVHSQPLPSQGFVLPLALKTYEALLGEGTALHDAVLQHTALARAFAVRYAHAGDPDFTGLDSQGLVDEPPSGSPPVTVAAAGGDTTYLLAADGEGNAVSLIQSVFGNWGSGLWAAEAGVLFNNRMTGFSLERGHPNELAPGKRPVHTLHCYLVTGEDGRLVAVGGTPGAVQQPQTNLQVLDAVLRRGEDPQDALDMPRWSLGSFAPFAADFRKVTVEAHEPDGMTAAFRDAGLTVQQVPAWVAAMGRAYLAIVTEDGVAAAGDVRGEGLAAVF